jgi:signal transduction histidine kinase
LIKIEVTDNGKGMSPNVKTNGIGLPSVKSKVKLLKGEINIASEPGEGTRISVSLPYYIN